MNAIRTQRSEVRGQKVGKNLASVFCHLSSAFTLIELMIVVIIIAALSAMVIPRLGGRTEQAKIAIAETDINSNIAMALKLYELDNGNFPAAEQGLKRLL